RMDLRDVAAVVQRIALDGVGVEETANIVVAKALADRTGAQEGGKILDTGFRAQGAKNHRQRGGRLSCTLRQRGENLLAVEIAIAGVKAEHKLAAFAVRKAAEIALA